MELTDIYDLKSFHSYKIPSDGFDIYFYMTSPYGHGVSKYGKNDNPALENVLKLIKSKKYDKNIGNPKEISITDPGMKDIPEFIIKEIFTQNRIEVGF